MVFPIVTKFELAAQVTRSVAPSKIGKWFDQIFKYLSS